MKSHLKNLQYHDDFHRLKSIKTFFSSGFSCFVRIQVVLSRVKVLAYTPIDNSYRIFSVKQSLGMLSFQSAPPFRHLTKYRLIFWLKTLVEIFLFMLCLTTKKSLLFLVKKERKCGIHTHGFCGRSFSLRLTSDRQIHGRNTYQECE